MPAPKFTIEKADGSTEIVKFSPKAQIAFERDTGEALYEEDGSFKVTKAWQMAWYAAGQPGSFDEWIETVEALTMGDESSAEGNDDERPTSPKKSRD